jgi:hypothetical protein
MINNNNSFQCGFFSAPLPQMVHFRDFGYGVRAGESVDRKLQGLVFDRFSRIRQDAPARRLRAVI